MPVWIGAIVVCLTILAFASHSRFNPHEHNLPTGCDEFGYLNMAKAISKGITFTDHAQRPFIDDLIADLAQKFPDTNHYRWMVAPHAYHIGPSGDAIINQYPPGVGLLLAWLPIEIRRISFPVTCVVLGGLALILAGHVDSRRRNLLDVALLPLLAFALYFSEPIVLELRRVDSLAPTYGLLIAAGWLLPRKPHWCLALLSATTLFRIPNALLFAPMGLACLFLSEPRAPSLPDLGRRAISLGATILCCGFGFYLLYAYLLQGNPFAPTYSSIDQEFADASDLAQNWRFYFVERNEWMLLHLAALAALGIVSACRRSLRWLLFGFALSIFNYAFYLFHKVQMDYYPYASAMVCIGLAIGVADIQSLGPWIRRITITSGALASIALALTSSRPNANDPQNFEAKLLPYKTAFEDMDVVWAEARSGTIEYATGKAGFRFNWGPDESRIFILNWLRDNGYRQAIWTDDHDMKPRSEIEAVLEKSAIPYTTENVDGIGEYLVISPSTYSSPDA